MIYFAHRGASGQRVQNTLPAFARARQLGARCYELDVHLTQDGFLTVHHDYDLSSTAGAAVEIKNISLAQLKNYPLANPFDGSPVFVPQLQDVLPLVEKDLQILNVEIKNDGNRYPGIEQKLLAELAAYSPAILAKTLFSSFDYDTLVRIRELSKNARIGQLTRVFDVSEALALKAESVHLNHTRFTPEIARICHDNGLKVYLYTVNEKTLAEELQRQGADGIFTDHIDLFVSQA